MKKLEEREKSGEARRERIAEIEAVEIERLGRLDSQEEEPDDLLSIVHAGFIRGRVLA